MSIVIHLRDPDRPTRAAQIEVLHVCQHPLCPFRDGTAATVTSVDDAPGDGQGQWDGPCVCEFTLESKREALLENLDLYPSSGLRFIEEDVLAYIADPDRVSARIRLVIQALGLYTVTGHGSRVTGHGSLVSLRLNSAWSSQASVPYVSHAGCRIVWARCIRFRAYRVCTGASAWEQALVRLARAIPSMHSRGPHPQARSTCAHRTDTST